MVSQNYLNQMVWGMSKLCLIYILLGFGNQPPPLDYIEKEIIAFNHEKKPIVYFEDERNNINVSTYLKSDVASFLDNKGIPTHSSFSVEKLYDLGGSMFIVNNKVYKYTIKNGATLVPYYITYFNHNKKEYVLINFFVVMWASQADYWNNIVLELDSNHNVVNITEISSYDGRITGKHILNYSPTWHK